MEACRHGVRLCFFCLKCQRESDEFRRRLEEAAKPKPSYDEELYKREFAL